MTNFETLIRDNGVKYNDRWSPYGVSTFEGTLSCGLLRGMNKNLRKNISYTLQYIQYIELQLDELHLHSIVQTMLYKTFIISGISIIEGIFYHLLKANGLWRQKEWELVTTVVANPIQAENETQKFETHVFRKIPKQDDEMNLDSMIKKIESKKLIQIHHKAFPIIKKLKRLRNKVHLQINEHAYDTDWWSFNYTDYLWMKYILYIVLTNESFDLSDVLKGQFDFIKPTNEEMQKLKDEVKRDKENDES